MNIGIFVVVAVSSKNHGNFEMTYVVFTTTQGEEMNEGPTLTSSCHCQAACVWARVLPFWYHFILPDTWKWSVVFMTTQRRRKARINFQLSNFGQVIAPEQWCLPFWYHFWYA